MFILFLLAICTAIRSKLSNTQIKKKQGKKPRSEGRDRQQKRERERVREKEIKRGRVRSIYIKKT